MIFVYIKNISVMHGYLCIIQTWNSLLAEMGQDWAAGCWWGHGNPDYGDRAPYKQIGQNIIYQTIGLDMTFAIKAFYDEKDDYNYDTLGCVPGRQCGHYTQVCIVSLDLGVWQYYEFTIYSRNSLIVGVILIAKICL